MRHGETGLGSEPHLVAGFEVLPFRHDAVRAVDAAADQVLHEVVAVEPATALPELDDPRPYLARRGPDGDGAGCGEVRVCDEVIAGKRLAGFPAGCAPPQLPGPAQQDVESRRTGKGRYARMHAPHPALPCGSRLSACASAAPAVSPDHPRPGAGRRRG